MDRISVVVPLYNGKKYINNIIKMMLENLYYSSVQYELELILVNDNPNECINTEEVSGMVKAVVNEYDDTFMLKQFSWIFLTNNTNKGIHFSRVYGMKSATGSYLHFLDQDDLISSDFYASHLSKIGNADVCVGNGVTQENGDKRLYRCYLMQWTVKHIYFYAKFDNRILSPGQCLIRKESIPDEWTENIIQNNGSDDYYLWLLMLAKKRKFSINREYVYTHINTKENVSLNTDVIHKSVDEVCEKLDSINNRIKGMIKSRVHKRRKSFFVKIVEGINRL